MKKRGEVQFFDWVSNRELAFTSLEESDNLSDPDVLAQEIVDDLEAALERFREIATDLGQ